MTTNVKQNSINEEKNSESDLLYHLKKIPKLFRTSALLKLITEKKLKIPKLSTALKAIIILFPKEERYHTLNLLNDNLDIQLTSSQVEELKSCLLQDPAFNNLLPFKQKKVLESFLVQQNVKKCISPI